MLLGLIFSSILLKLFSEIPTPMAARTMKLVANSLIKLANLVDAKVHGCTLCHISGLQLSCSINVSLELCPMWAPGP